MQEMIYQITVSILVSVFSRPWPFVFFELIAFCSLSDLLQTVPVKELSEQKTIAPRVAPDKASKPAAKQQKGKESVLSK